MPYILAAILTNLGYAFGNTATGMVSKRNSPYKVATWASLFGVVIFFIPLLLFFQDELHRLTTVNVAIVLGLGFIGALGYLSFITGMSKGSVTLTGVIGGSFPAITTFVSLLVFHERVTTLQAIAMLAIFVGVILSSLEASVENLVKDITSSAIIYGLGAFLLWGIYYALIKIPVERVGWFVPQFGSNLFAAPIYPLLARRRGEQDTLSRPPKLAWLIAVIAVLQMSASMLYSYAIHRGPIAIVAPIAGSSPAVFVVLAFFIFEEKLNGFQKLGILIAVAGIVGLSCLG